MSRVMMDKSVDGTVGDELDRVVGASSSPALPLGLWLLAVGLLASALAAAAVAFAVSVPWLDIQFSRGAAPQPVTVAGLPYVETAPLVGLVAAGLPPLRLESGDLAPEPDTAHAADPEFERFMQRQERITRRFHAPGLALLFADGSRVPITPQASRPLHRLPILFWFQLGCAVSSLLVGGTIWAFRRRQPAAIYSGLAGLGAALMEASAAVYSTRELALPETLFRALSTTNHFGALFTGVALVGVMWHYPRRLAARDPVPLLGAFALLVLLLEQLHLSPLGQLTVNATALVLYLLALVLTLMQWRHLGRDPIARAAWRWFAISWLFGSGMFLILVSAPAVAGYDTGSLQPYGFAFLLLIQIGLGLGILRYRLYQLEGWWLRALLTAGGAIIVLLLDLLFLALFDFDRPVNLLLALSCAGWLYFPFRQLLLARLIGHSASKLDDLPQLLRLLRGTGPLPTERLLQESLLRFFRPLSLHDLGEPPRSEVEIAGSGISLRVQALDPREPGIELCWPERGERLFTPGDVERARNLRQLLLRVTDYRRAVADGVSAERKRLASDLHDDVGARLLTLIHRSEAGTAQLARDALENLRAVVHGLADGSRTLQDSLSRWRVEAVERCEAAGVDLVWQPPGNASSRILLGPSQVIHLDRFLREAITNALRHARPTHVDVYVGIDDDRLCIQVCNDGVTLPVERWPHGLGLRNMRQRVERLGGHLTLRVRDGRAEVRCEVPQSVDVTPLLGGAPANGQSPDWPH
jgi:Signal transduction histidine kinase